MFSIATMGGLAGAGDAIGIPGGPGGTQIFLDTFFEPSVNTPLQSHTPDVGTSWTKFIDVCTACDIRALAGGFNDARNAVNRLSGRIAYTADATYGTNDYDVICKIHDPTGMDDDDPWWLFARVTDLDNFYAAGAYLAGANPDIFIFKRVAGVNTVLDSANLGLAFTTETEVKFQVRDAAKKLFVGGVERLSTTDDAITAIGKAGLGLGSVKTSTDDAMSLWSFDDFEVREF